MTDTSFLKNVEWTNSNILATTVLVVSFFIVRSLLTGVVRKWSFKDAEEKRQKIVTLKNYVLLVFLLALISVWGTELRAFAISLVAVAAALVIATKELILCLMGGILRASTSLFRVGDRIEIKEVRGEVIDHNLLVTILFEIGPGSKSNQFTGRVLKIPNAQFLTDSVVVEPRGNHYNLTVFKIPMPFNGKLKDTEGVLLDVARTVCEPYFENANRHIRDICRKEGVETPALEPRVLYHILDKETIEYHIRMPVPFNKKSQFEKQLLELFFERIEAS